MLVLLGPNVRDSAFARVVLPCLSKPNKPRVRWSLRTKFRNRMAYSGSDGIILAMGVVGVPKFAKGP